MKNGEIALQVQEFGSVRIDKDSEDCKEVTEAAQPIIKQLLKSKDIKLVRKEFLPLQSSELWGKWSELEKKKNYEAFSTDDASQVDADMNEIRRLQAKKGVTPFMTKVIKELFKLQTKPKATDIFLQEIKLFLDEWSNECMLQLRKRRKQKWKKLRKTREKYEVRDHLEAEYEQALNDISESSFGIEHICRENGHSTNHFDCFSDTNDLLTNV